MELATLLVVNALVFLVLLVWLRRKVDRELNAERAIERVRREVADLITELNGTTERNITLIEDRVKRISDLLQKTDKKIAMLQRESEKHDIGLGVYTDLMERRRRTARESASARGSDEGSGSSEMSEQTPVHDASTGSADDQDIDQSPGDSRGQGSSGRSLRNRVRDLHRAGMAAEAIARKVGSSLGEVELIIGLETGGDSGAEEDEDGRSVQE